MADTAANFLAFLPSLGTGEAFAFGEGVALPTRIKFRQLPAPMLPKSETVTLGDADAATATDHHSLTAVVERWRGRTAKPRPAFDRPGDELRPPPLVPADAPQAPAALDPNRFKLLKRPLDQSRRRADPQSSALKRLLRPRPRLTPSAPAPRHRLP